MTRLASIVALAGAAAGANAQLTFVGTNGDTLYRSTGGFVESFDLSRNVVGMDVRPNGEVWASTPDTDGPAEFYMVDNAFSGDASLSLIGASDNVYTSLTFTSNSDLFGFFNGSQQLFDIDPNTLMGELIDIVGVNDVTFGGSAYDPDGDVFYALGRDVNTDEVFLYSVDDFATAPDANLIGSTGVFGDGMGLDWFDGQLYAGIQNIDNMHFEAGSLNVGTGEFTLIETLAEDFAPDGNVTSIVVVPAPAGAALLGLAGVAALRRRRA